MFLGVTTPCRFLAAVGLSYSSGCLLKARVPALRVVQCMGSNSAVLHLQRYDSMRIP